MKKPLLALTVLSLSLGSIITPVTATAALPLSVDGEQLPSLAPMLEKSPCSCEHCGGRETSANQPYPGAVSVLLWP